MLLEARHSYFLAVFHFRQAWSERRGHEILLAKKARVPELRKQRERHKASGPAIESGGSSL